ncbi:MAG: phage major capsid protein [Firmicutes bacterium HGW-Firmicutes-15]|jgi:hypothetical protein|nr:MAG: phage major capsid protein [Firmicutes bacterium HGW-Firmicutes-15]
MKLNTNKELLASLTAKIEGAPVENKTEAILSAMHEFIEASTAGIVEQYAQDAVRAQEDADFAKSLGLRTLNKDEKAFYSKFGVGVKNALTFEQEDVIPVTIIERTLDSVKKESGLLGYVRIVPAGVKKWISAAATGAAAWGAITASISAELSATITGINMDAFRLAAYLLVPKGIVALGEAYVDRYFRAILAEAMVDGLEYAVIDGDGKDEPIGFSRLLNTSVDGVHTAKTAVALATFAPEDYGPVIEVLTNGGKRKVEEVLLICNPADYFATILPASMSFVNGTWAPNFSFPTRVIQTVNCDEGSPVLALPNMYDLGIQAVKLDVYKETKALDDVDVLIAKTYGNGRAVDDACAVVLDISGLARYIDTVNTVAVV